MRTTVQLPHMATGPHLTSSSGALPPSQPSARNQALIPLGQSVGTCKPSSPAGITGSGLRFDSGPLVCPWVETGLVLTYPCHPAQCRVHVGGCPVQSHTSLLIELSSHGMIPTITFDFSSLFYFVETEWYFIVRQRCPEGVCIMFFKQNFIPR